MILRLDYSEFAAAYKRFLTETGDLHYDNPDGRVVTIYETDWVQILFVSDYPTSEGIKLVVEVSLPAWVQERSIIGNVHRVSAYDSPPLREVLKAQIMHLEYLL